MTLENLPLYRKFDVAVIPGKNLLPGVTKTDIAINPNHLTDLSMINVMAGIIFVERGYAPQIIFSGGESFPGFPEGSLMADLAVLISKIDPGAVKNKELQAMSTYHNAKYSAEIIRNLGFEKVAVISTRAHLKRLLKHFARERLNVSGIPAEDLVALKYPSFIDKIYPTLENVKEEIKRERFLDIINSAPLGLYLERVISSLRR